MLNIKRIFIILICLASSTLYSESVETQLKKVPLHDRVHMTYFFRYLYEKNQLGYVLLCDHKPSCYAVEILVYDVPQKHRASGRCKLMRKYHLKGWKAWKKHEHLFQHDNFIISSAVRDFPIAVGSWKRLNLYVINKKTLNTCLGEHQELFTEILGDAFSPKDFIAALEQGAFIEDLIQGDEALKGILLGFAPSSALSYKKRALHQLPKETLECQGIDVVSEVSRSMYPIRWAGDPTQEDVKVLQQKYKSDTEKVISQYDRKHTLRFILESLCSNPT